MEELGIEPGPALQRLERSILVQDPELELAVAAPPPEEPALASVPPAACRAAAAAAAAARGAKDGDG